MPKITDYMKRRMTHLYTKEGLDGRTIATRLGISKSSVYRFFKLNNITRVNVRRYV